MNADPRLDVRDAVAERLRMDFDGLMAWVRSWVAAKCEADDAVDAYPWNNLLALARDPLVVTAMRTYYQAGIQRAAGAMMIGVQFPLQDPRALEYAQDRAAELVGRRRLPDGRLVDNPDARWSLPKTTRDQVRGLVVGMLDQGTSYRDLKHDIEALSAFGGLFGEYRAEMIARTEVALAAATGAVDLFASHGLTHLHVIDNDRCPICAPVAGTVQPIAWCRDNPIGHPNCIRSFRPPTAAEMAAARAA